MLSKEKTKREKETEWGKVRKGKSLWSLEIRNDKKFLV
jgi:hypothetical protein